MPLIRAQLHKDLLVGFLSSLIRNHVTAMIIQVRAQSEANEVQSLSYPFRFLVTVEHTLAVQLEAISTFIHAFKYRRRRLTNHWDTAPLFPGSIVQALNLQELASKT